jgi:hypothetical protein
MSAQNVFDVLETFPRSAAATPEYAALTRSLTTGVRLTLGVKATI